MQADSQMQSRLSVMDVKKGDYDPLEFDRYTRFQELTRSLAEGVNDVATVQQSLLKNLDDADVALGQEGCGESQPEEETKSSLHEGESLSKGESSGPVFVLLPAAYSQGQSASFSKQFSPAQ